MGGFIKEQILELAAAESAWRARLREGVTVEDCGEALVCAAAFTAAADLAAGRGGVTSFSAGDISVKVQTAESALKRRRESLRRSAELMSRAAKLNSERVVLVGPGGPPERRSAEGLGRACPGLQRQRHRPAGPERRAAAGVRGGVVSPVRGITTRTKTGGVGDATWWELTTILVVDDVIPAVWSALRSKFSRSKNNARNRAAIRFQVIVELEKKVAAEIIDSYDGVTVTASEETPTVCLVEFGFSVAHGLNQVRLTAHIEI